MTRCTNPYCVDGLVNSVVLGPGATCRVCDGTGFMPEPTKKEATPVTIERDRIVICLNDFPECVLPPDTTDEQAENHCRQLKADWLLKHPESHPHRVRFHAKRVPELRRLPVTTRRTTGSR